MKPRKLSIEVQLGLRNLLLPTIGLHHMEGRFPHLLTLLKIKFPLHHYWDPQKVPHKHMTPTVFIRSREEENPSRSKPMPTFDPTDLIGRTFLLPPEENGERHRAKVTRKVVEIIDKENGHRGENINFILDIGNGKVEEMISYNQVLAHLETAQDNDLGMNQEHCKFRAIIGHQGPLAPSDSDWKGSKYNVQCWKHPSPFSNVHFRNTTKIAAQVLALNFSYLLLSLFSNYELFMYFCFCSFFHSYGSFNHVNFNILELL